MKGWMSKIKISIIVAAQLISLPALSAIPRSDRHINLKPWDMQDYTKVKVVESINMIKPEDVALVIPYNSLAPTKDMGTVASQILDHSLGNLVKSSLIRNSSFARAASRMDNLVDTKVNFGSGKEGEVQHKLEFKVKAAQTKAQLSYSGFVNAQVVYQINTETLNLEVSEDLGKATKVVFAHTFDKTGTSDSVNVRWEF